MADFKKNNHFTHSARKPFRSGPPGGRDFGGPREMFDAECANCHKMTQVPFRPNGKKPVFCRDCFQAEGGERAGDRPPHPARPQMRDFGPKRPFPPRPERDSRIDDIQRQLSAMNATLEKLTGILEKSGRAAALSEEMQKYRAPEEKKAKKAAPKKKAKKA
jgi:CxxC-x17-CxxC domain-containing protein